MRNALGPLLAVLLLAGCEDNKLITPPPAETPPPAPAVPAAPAPDSPAPAPPKTHGATGVGDTAPVPVLAPPKPPGGNTASDWAKAGGADAGPATDGGGPRGPRAGDSQGPLKP